MIDIQQIKIVLDGEIGAPLKMYLMEQLKDLKNIENIKEYSKAQDQAIEYKAQLKAYTKLEQILEDILTIEEESSEGDENEYSTLE